MAGSQEQEGEGDSQLAMFSWTWYALDISSIDLVKPECATLHYKACTFAISYQSGSDRKSVHTLT